MEAPHREYERRLKMWLALSYLAIFLMAAAIGIYALVQSMQPFPR